MRFLFLALTLFLSFPAFSWTITGKVVRVADGDTFTIITSDNKKVRIRFWGIDAPETEQSFGKKAGAYVRKLCLGKQIQVEAKYNDRYHRPVGVVFIGKRNLNEDLLKQGLAWNAPMYSKSDRYANLQAKAQKNRKNIWSEKNPMPPWEFRKMKREQQKEKCKLKSKRKY